ncbi:hypothetical protein J6590_073311 [Homalodisca vitripennis]|nr:hypothetical protein J6590_073311 [Homalodisca vitripennis]
MTENPNNEPGNNELLNVMIQIPFEGLGQRLSSPRFFLPYLHRPARKAIVFSAPLLSRQPLISKPQLPYR